MSAGLRAPRTMAAASSGRRPPGGWRVPVIVGFALLMQTLNATVVFNALPAMAMTFGVEPLRLNLAVTLYLLSVAVFLPISGWMADRFGARRVFLAATALYAIGSAACGFAQDLEQLVLARIAQGAAGAAMLPVGRLILLRTTPKAQLVGAMAVMTMPALLGPVIGPVVGGAIVTFADWRWVFFMNLPIALLGILFIWRYVPDVKEQGVRPVDVLGAALTGVGLGALILGCDALGRRGASVGEVAGFLGAGLAALALYGWHARRTPHAVIDLSIFRRRSYSAAVIGGAFVRVSIGASPFLLVMLLQVGFGLSAFEAGLIVAVSGGAALLMRVAAPPILRRLGFRTVLIANGVLVGASFLANALLSAAWPTWAMMAVLGVSGFFRSLQFTALNGLAYAEIEPERMSAAATTSSMILQLVQAVGVGMVATLLQLLGPRDGNPAAAAPAVFVVLGVLTMVSIAWFLRLPKDVGDEMNGRLSAVEKADGEAV